MPVHDDLGTRMKEYYEQIPKTKLMRRMPVIIRLDGKAFHTFTKGFQKPFDEVLMKSMQGTMKYLCENIQGCVLGYTQSDEITLVLVDYKKLTSAAWFDYEVQKMCSIAASMATMAFNRIFLEEYVEFCGRCAKYDYHHEGDKEMCQKLMDTYKNAVDKGAMFDARCFNIPKEEVTNCIFWRQLDATRNSIQMVGQAYFSHKELHQKTCSMIQDMLMEQKGVNWNDLPLCQKRGVCAVKNKIITGNDGMLEMYVCRDDSQPENAWIIDKEIPIFKGDGRKYIDELIFIGE